MRLREDVVDPRTLHRVPLSHWVRHALALLGVTSIGFAGHVALPVVLAVLLFH